MLAPLYAFVLQPLPALDVEPEFPTALAGEEPEDVSAAAVALHSSMPELAGQALLDVATCMRLTIISRC